MTKLTTDARKKLPAREFAGPHKTYPIEDAAHAKNAKSRAAQAVKAGRMSVSDQHRIDAKADKKLFKILSEAWQQRGMPPKGHGCWLRIEPLFVEGLRH